MPPADPSAAEPPADGPVDAPRRGAGASREPSRAFPRDARLLDGRAYDRVFGDNRRVADRLWTVLAHRLAGTAERPGDEPCPDGDARARLGLAIAKKRARRAVDRNRIKRVARESFRHARASLAGHHVVVMNRDAAATASAAELRAALDALWRRLARVPAGQGGRGGGGRSAAVTRSEPTRSSRARAADVPPAAGERSR